MKHTEVPHQLDMMKDNHQLEHGDKIIYAAIRRYMNKTTRECFPAIRTIASSLKCSNTKVLKAIERLLQTGLLQKSYSGRKNCYYFPETEFDKKFEMFTDSFLDLDLELNVKEYYMDIQQYLYGKDTGVGKCSFSNTELSRRTGWSVPSIKKYNTILINNGLLEEEMTGNYDAAGLPIVQKSFDLNGLQQAALWVKAVTEQVTLNTADIEDLKTSNEEMKSEIEKLTKKLADLEKLQSLERNKIKETAEYKM